MPRRNLTPRHAAIAFSPESEFEDVKVYLANMVGRWPADRRPVFVRLLREFLPELDDLTSTQELSHRD